MNMIPVRKINGVVCEIVNDRQIKMYGRKKMVYWKGGKMVENHVLTGKWTRTVIGQQVIFTVANKPSKWKMLAHTMGKCAIAFFVVIALSINT
jgi:hypothetical protein